MSNLSYARDGLKLVVEEIDNSLVITYANLEAVDVYHLTIELVQRLGAMTGQGYSGTLNDLKEITEESK